MSQKRKQTTYRCDAYPFPHRLYGGHCSVPDDDEDDDDDYINPFLRQRRLEYELLGCSFREFTNPTLT
ncbi:MAG: hypothetical protein ACKN9E_13450 [Microcystaceae cyanobacterium]